MNKTTTAFHKKRLTIAIIITALLILTLVACKQKENEGMDSSETMQEIHTDADKQGGENGDVEAQDTEAQEEQAPVVEEFIGEVKEDTEAPVEPVEHQDTEVVIPEEPKPVEKPVEQPKPAQQPKPAAPEPAPEPAPAPEPEPSTPKKDKEISEGGQSLIDSVGGAATEEEWRQLAEEAGAVYDPETGGMQPLPGSGWIL